MSTTVAQLEPGAPESRGSRDGVTPLGLIIVAAVLLPVCLGYALATGNENQVLAVVLGVLTMIAIVAQPFVGLIAFVILLFTRPEESVPALAGMHLALVISCTTLATCLLSLALNRERLVRSPLNLMVTGFAIWATVASLPQGDTVNVMQDFLKLAVLVFITVNLVRTPGRYAALISVVIALTCYLAGFALYLYCTGHALEYQGGDEMLVRALGTGIFNDPNDLAAAIVSGFALTLGRVISRRGWARLLYIGATLLMLVAIASTNSRGGTVALGMVLLCFGAIVVRRKAAGFAVMAFILALFMVISPSRMKSFDNQEESANMRFWFWTNGIEQFLQNPVTGVGTGHFIEVNGGHTAHNSYVLVFAETGLPGYLLWMGALYYGLRKRSMDSGDLDERDRPAAADVQASRVALIGFLTAGFFLSKSYDPLLVLLVTLPVAADGAFKPHLAKCQISQGYRKDFGRIGAISLASIVAINIIAVLLR